MHGGGAESVAGPDANLHLGARPGVNRWRRALLVLMGCVGMGTGMGTAHAEPLLHAFGAALGAPAAPWELALLPRQRKPVTQFRVVDAGGHAVLRVEAERSYGNLLHPLPEGTAAARLAWRWRVELLNEAADLTQRNGDDTTLKVCALWDEPIDQLPFTDRQTLRVARAVAGVPLPAATVCYVWDARLAEGTEVASPFTQRVRYVVLRHGNARADAGGGWQLEKRNIAADFMHFFGKEVTQLPPLLGIAVGADADNTQGHSIGYVGDVTLER